MSKKYESLAASIVEKVGGAENVRAVRHCQTRLRFTLKDTQKADREALQKMDGVAQVVESADGSFDGVPSGGRQFPDLLHSELFRGCGVCVPADPAGLHNGAQNEMQRGHGGYRGRYYVSSQLGRAGVGGRTGQFLRDHSVLSGGLYLDSYPGDPGDRSPVLCGKGAE